MKLRLAVLCAVLLTATFTVSAQALVQTFSVPTGTTAATESMYALEVGAGIGTAVVEEGELRLYGVRGAFAYSDVSFGQPLGDAHFEFDARVSDPGNVTFGVTVGDARFAIAPGFTDTFFLEVPYLGTATGGLGFVPDYTLWTHMAVDIDVAKDVFTVTVKNGANIFTGGYFNPTYEAGESLVGVNMSSNPGAYAAFDNAVRSAAAVTPVPEPSTVSLMALGVAAIAVARRRRVQPTTADS